MSDTMSDTPNSKKNPWFKPGFLIVVVFLAVSAGGFNAVVSSLQLKFIKDPVALKKELTTVPVRMGDWVQVSTDEPINKELEDELGTKMYIFRDYVNAKLVSPADLARFEGKTSSERKAIVSELQSARPEAVLNAAVTYYTGKVDTVAHIPERCYVADGYQYTDTPETLLWDLGPGRLGTSPDEAQRIGVRFLNFEDQTGARRVTRRVAYFFFANGKYESDNLDVRQTLQNLRAKHAFYSKVELMSIVPDHDQCAAVMTGFLRSALPEIEKCLPDWDSAEHPEDSQTRKVTSDKVTSVKLPVASTSGPSALKQ